ncbi:alpha/beta fold hydrolase [Candidatus Woesearchaeota archaeon]|nr:alpha/beta fold hydrolase [Candidatus Woesearchaeota archaeon]
MRLFQFGVVRGFLVSHRKYVLAAAIVAALILLLASGTKLFLFLNFFAGNDIVVRLEAEKTHFELVRGTGQNVTFTSSVTTNPFCAARCVSEFADLSGNISLEEDSFYLKAGFPLVKSYSLKAAPYGSGQKLYRFSMECRSVSTALCHTDGEPTRRAILVTADYDLGSVEKSLKEYLQPALNDMAQRVAAIKMLRGALSNASASLGRTVVAEDFDAGLSSVDAAAIDRQLLQLHQLWQEQDYAALAQGAEELDIVLNAAEESLAAANSSMQRSIYAYNGLLDNLSFSRQQLLELEGIPAAALYAGQVNATISAFNDAVVLFGSRNGMEFKKAAVDSASRRVSSLLSEIRAASLLESVNRSVSAAVSYEYLCSFGFCAPNKPVINLSAQQFDYAESCTAAGTLHEFYFDANSSMAQAFSAEQYPVSEEFWSDVGMHADALLHNISQQAMSGIPNMSDDARRVLEGYGSGEVSSYPEFNLTPALVAALSEKLPGRCSDAQLVFNAVSAVLFVKLQLDMQQAAPNVSFDEQPLMCCVWGSCSACCVSAECLGSDSDAPVVFLHGHALNKDVSAEYSLDAFNRIQQRLEADGYLNAGVITLYTEQDSPSGVWGMSGVPLSIRASYYLDLFEQPENYVVIQAKSESIDTYAVRLKEIVDRVKYRTGRPKVTIIAHSMGSLVARRYVQLFGPDSVRSLILIGSPNSGIAGSIADFCPVAGERLECRDMSAGSLFLNKLNRSPPSVQVHNIVGTGCSMGQGAGDGFVLESSAVMEGALNYPVNGTCTRFAPLHTEMLDIDKYPEVYDIIIEALRS